MEGLPGTPHDASVGMVFLELYFSCVLYLCSSRSTCQAANPVLFIGLPCSRGTVHTRLSRSAISIMVDRSFSRAMIFKRCRKHLLNIHWLLIGAAISFLLIDSLKMMVSTPVQYYVSAGNTEKVQKYVHKGGDVDLLLLDGSSLVILAADKDDLGMVKLLLANGANPDLRNPECHWIYTALHLAVVHDNAEMVSALLESGANPNLRVDESAETPLETAIKRGNGYVLKQFADKGIIDSMEP